MSNKILSSAPARLHSIASHLSNNARSFTTTLPAMSSSSKDSKPNYTGLTPAESKALPSREARPEEAFAIATLQDLYKCKPTEESYKSYTPDAIFHDPVGIAKGIASIKAQFNALPALFPRADITKVRSSGQYKNEVTIADILKLCPSSPHSHHLCPHSSESSTPARPDLPSSWTKTTLSSLTR